MRSSKKGARSTSGVLFLYFLVVGREGKELEAFIQISQLEKKIVNKNLAEVELNTMRRVYCNLWENGFEKVCCLKRGDCIPGDRQFVEKATKGLGRNWSSG